MGPRPPHAVSLPRKALAYLALGRISNLPTVWTNGLAGVILAGGSLTSLLTAALLLALSLFYVGGMFLNDAFDRHIDARERPERPLPAGLVTAGEAFRAGYGLLASGWLLVLLVAQAAAPPGDPWSASLAGLGLAILIVAYNVHHKSNPWSPLVMGACRALTYVIAALAVAGTLPADVLAGTASLLSYLIGLTALAKHRRGTRWPAAFLCGPFLFTWPLLLDGGLGTILYLGFLSWVGYVLFLQQPIAPLIAGIALLDALLIAGQGETTAAGLAVLGFGLTLALQRLVRGT